MYTQYNQHLAALHNSHQYRRLVATRQVRNSAYLDFSTNDYLNLSCNSEVIEAAITYTRLYGVGATGSRLLSGNLELYRQFEDKIAADKNTEASLIFNSGFQVNTSVLSSLLDEKVLKAKPIVFFDKLNHSSLYQAVFLSQAELRRYPHNNMQQLEALLDKYKDDPRPKFIVTESIFGMAGDIAPLNYIAELARQYKAFLYVDEAHATGVLGADGYGLSSAASLQDIPHIVMGTFSKGLGSSGGYIACHKVLRDFIINKASGFIYSTAPSPAAIGAAFKAWDMVRGLSKERDYLQNLGAVLRTSLKELGYNIGTSTTHIVPIILGNELACLRLKDALLNEQIVVSAIRPPTVPPHTSCLRIALTVKHQLSDVEKLVASLQKVM